MTDWYDAKSNNIQPKDVPFKTMTGGPSADGVRQRRSTGPANEPVDADYAYRNDNGNVYEIRKAEVPHPRIEITSFSSECVTPQPTPVPVVPSACDFDTVMAPSAAAPGARVQISGGQIGSKSFVTGSLDTVVKPWEISPVRVYPAIWEKVFNALEDALGPAPGGLDSHPLQAPALIGAGDYPDAMQVRSIWSAAAWSIDGFLVDRGTTIRFYKEKNFQGGIAAEFTGPVLYNVLKSFVDTYAWDPDDITIEGERIGDLLPDGHLLMSTETTFGWGPAPGAASGSGAPITAGMWPHTFTQGSFKIRTGCEEPTPVPAPCDLDTVMAPSDPVAGGRVHFCGLMLHSHSNGMGAQIFKAVPISADDGIDYFPILGPGDYPDAPATLEGPIKHTLDSIAIDSETRLIVYEKENFEGSILYDGTGPIVMHNSFLPGTHAWLNQVYQIPQKTLPATAYLPAHTLGWDNNATDPVTGETYTSIFPPESRIYSSVDMYKWIGSFKIRSGCG